MRKAFTLQYSVPGAKLNDFQLVILGKAESKIDYT
jgi:hypothetical protein